MDASVILTSGILPATDIFETDNFVLFLSDMTSTERQFIYSVILHEFTQKLRENNDAKLKILAKKIEDRLFVRYKEAILNAINQKTKVGVCNEKLQKLRDTNLVLQGDLEVIEVTEELQDIDIPEDTHHLGCPEPESSTDFGTLEGRPEETEANRSLDEKTFECKGLRAQTQKYTEERPFKCTTCEKSFKRRRNLIDHNRIHTGEKPYKCDFCDQYFRLRSTLRQHRSIHTRDLRFKCEICYASFRRKEDLTKHARVHSAGKP